MSKTTKYQGSLELREDGTFYQVTLVDAWKEDGNETLVKVIKTVSRQKIKPKTSDKFTGNGKSKHG